MNAIAIDFGSSNTVIAKWNIATNKPETLNFAQFHRPSPLESLVPSLIYVHDAAREIVDIGQVVIDRGRDYAQPRLFSHVKRRLMTQNGYIPSLDGVKITPEWLGNQFLRSLMEKLRSQQIFPTEIILTAPVQAYEKYLRWLEECSSQIFASHLPTLELPQIKILDEPTAAALGYGMTTPSELVLVIDFGGGTLDVALVRLPSNQDSAKWGDQLGTERYEWSGHRGEVIAKTGYTLGGEDIDQWLLQDYLEHLYRDQDLKDLDKENNLQERWTDHSLNKLPHDPAHNANILKFLMEKIKIKLSDEQTASEFFFDIHSQSTVEISYDRQQLHQILHRQGFYRVLQLAIDELVHRAFNKGILKGDIKHIFLVGGCTLIPSVVSFIQDYFPLAEVLSHKPFEAIAHGALLLSQGSTIQDHLFHSYAIRYRDRQSEQWKYQPLFRSGQPYPSQRPVELLLRASQTDQPEIALTIGEIENRPRGGAEISFDGDRLMMQFSSMTQETFQPLRTDLNGEAVAQAIALLDPLGQPDQDRLKVIFRISTNRELLVTVIDLLTQQHLLTEQSVARLS